MSGGTGRLAKASSFGAASGGSGASVTTPAAGRFSLLLLEDGEYYFKGHTACLWPEEGKRVVGSLQVCSRSLFFVPRDLQQPITRIPFQATTAITPLDDVSPHGEDQFEVVSSRRVEMQAGGADAPYVAVGGAAALRFSLVYASLEDVVPAVEELCLLAHAAAAARTKEERAAAAARLQDIVREHEEGELFNPGWLEDEESVVAQAVAAAVSPLAAQPGRAVLTQHRVYFQPFNARAGAPLEAYPLARVVAAARRVHQLEDVGLELFFSSRHSLYLAFRGAADRDAFQRALLAQPAAQPDRMRSREAWTRDWVAGRISNFDYLMHLNREAGRSFKDLSQYPVMPWVVADYSSPTLDLGDPATFRDLSKPVGALAPRRLAEFRARFAELKAMAAPAPAGRGRPGAPPPLDAPPFLYGCHYSSPGYVVFFLMRSDPQLMLRLQNGRFDAPDRLFWSVADCWKSVLSLPSDVKELVPEFYGNDPSFLLNKRGVDFGRRAGGEAVGDVALPPWAADADDFLFQLREALESPLVSAHLHKWIDLVFGRKSRGPAAERADNVFHYLTYDEVALAWLEREADPLMREALRLQMMEFGRTPRQLFTRKHPRRRVLGRGGALVCFACFAPPQPQPRLPANLLAGKPFGARAIPPVSRAVFKLACGPKPEQRAALLAYLEHAAAHGEPDALALRQTRGAELFMLVRAAREARDGRPGGGAAPRASPAKRGAAPRASPAKRGAAGPAAAGGGDDALDSLVRASAALAACPQNRRYLLEAGCLEGVAGALGTPRPALAAAAARALALLAREDSPRLAALDARALGALGALARAAPGGEAQMPALDAITHLAEAYPAHRACFAGQGLVALLLEQLRASRELAAAADPEPGEPSPLSPGSAPPLSQRGAPRALRRRSTMAGALGGGPHPALLQAHQLLALAALLLDEPARQAVAGSPGELAALVADCGAARAEVRAGAFECLASLAAGDALRQQAAALRLLPLLLEGAGSGSAAVRQPAAAALAGLCADPAPVLRELARDGRGLAGVAALAGSPDGEVQRHAAAALWHLLQLPEARRGAAPAGALPALLALAALPRNPAARDLARHALLRCRDDDAVRPRLEEAAAAAGLDAGGLAALVAPGSARSAASFQRKARHRKMYSDVPSSVSGAISRSSSYRSAADNSPAHALNASPAAALWPAEPGSGSVTPAGTGSSPLQLSPVCELAAEAPVPPDGAPLAANGAAGPPAQQPMAPPPRLQLPQGPPLPIPLITPVAVGGGSASPPAKRHPPQAETPRSAGEQEAAAASPKGAVRGRVQHLDRLHSHPVPPTPE